MRGGGRIHLPLLKFWGSFWQYLMQLHNISCQTAWAWRHNVSVDQLHAGQQATNSHTCKRNSGGVCDQGLSARGHFIAPAVRPGWMNSQRDSMRMVAIHWGMQIISLSLSAENFQTLSRSFFRELPVWYNSGVIGLSYLSLHKRWW